MAPAVFVSASSPSTNDDWRTITTFSEPKNKILGGYHGGKVRGGREFDAPSPPKRGRGRPRKHPVESKGAPPPAKTSRAPSQKEPKQPPKRREEVNNVPKHAKVPDKDILCTSSNTYNNDAIYSESIEDNYVFYDHKLPSHIIREGEYLGYAGGSHVYHRNERTCVRMLVAEEQRLNLEYDDGMDVSAGLPSNSTRAAHNDREDLVCKLEYSPADKGLDFDQMREAWQNDEKLYIFGWE